MFEELVDEEMRLLELFVHVPVSHVIRLSRRKEQVVGQLKLGDEDWSIGGTLFYFNRIVQLGKQVPVHGVLFHVLNHGLHVVDQVHRLVLVVDLQLGQYSWSIVS